MSKAGKWLLANPDASDRTPNADARAEVVRRGCYLLSAIILASVCSIGLAGLCSLVYPIIISHSLLAFALGLRHAVDCDHLAAIDNVTRQLMNRGQSPVSVGFWFAMGHSTVVVIMTAVLAGGYSMAWKSLNHSSHFTDRISLVAAVLSVSLLAVIGLANAKIAVGLFRHWVGRTESDVHDDLDSYSFGSAITSLPCLRRAFENVDKPFKMYGVGFLFGLSFDTATQVALIGLAAIAGTNQQVPPLMVMIFPLCFSCGMCLVDTANGLLMLFTYSWAQIEPHQKLFYNFIVTALSAGVALSIGSLELLQIIQREFHYKGPFWTAVKSVDMASLGYAVISAFVLALTVAICGSRCIKSAGTNDRSSLTAPLNV